MGYTRTIARNSFWTLVDNLISLASTIGCSIAVARKLGPANLGYYNYIIWLASMAGMVATFGIPAATRRYAAEYIGRGEFGIARAIVRTTYRVQLGFALAAVATGTAFVAGFVPAVHRAYAALAVASLLPYLMYSIPNSAIMATEDLLPNVQVSVVTTVANAIGVALTLILGWGLVGLAGTMLAQRTLDYFLRQYYFKRIFARYPATAPADERLPDELRRRIIRFCWQSTLLTLVEIAVWERSEMIFLERYSGIVQVAFFSLGYNIAQNLLMLPRVASAAASATIAAQQGRDPRGTAALAIGTARVLTLLCVPAAFGLASVSGSFLHVLYGAKYLPVIPVLTVMAIFTLGKALQMPARQLLMSTENQGTLMGWELALVLPNLGLDFLLVPSRGAIGGAAAKAIIQSIGAVSVWAIVWRKFGARLPITQLVKTLAAGGVMFLIVRAVAAGLPPLLGLIVGVPIGVAVILIAFRLFGCLDPQDRAPLEAIQKRLPSRLRGAWATLVSFMVPSRAGAAPLPG